MTYFQPTAIVVPTPFQPPVLTQSHIKGGVGSPWGATAPLGSLRHRVSKLLARAVKLLDTPLATQPTAPHSRATWFHCPTSARMRRGHHSGLSGPGRGMCAVTA